MPRSSQVEPEVDALYGLRPGEFVAARDELARRLRREGHREEADAVKALARPTAAAWAVNQLSRREPEWTQALVTAGRRLLEAHERLLEHGDREGWRDAGESAREAVDRLTQLAEQILREERGSVSGVLRDQVRETLQAATLDADARDAVAAGRLTRELRPPGGLPLGERAGRFAPGGGDQADHPGRDRPARRRPATRANADREARAARRAAEREARAALRRAERERTAAQVAVERADQALARAERARALAAEALAEAQQLEQERIADLEAAERAREEAARALEERERAVAEARAAFEQAREPGDSR